MAEQGMPGKLHQGPGKEGIPGRIRPDDVHAGQRAYGNERSCGHVADPGDPEKGIGDRRRASCRENAPDAFQKRARLSKGKQRKAICSKGSGITCRINIKRRTRKTDINTKIFYNKSANVLKYFVAPFVYLQLLLLAYF